ncbi:MAG: sulfurtransferase [Micavibrio sp.]
MSLLSANGVVQAQDLYYLLGSGKQTIRLLDAGYGSPAPGLSPYQAFLSAHIEGAQFFDVNAIADQDSPLPHMLPDPAYFESSVESLGISSGDHVVVYDQSGYYMASSRAWWMFRYFGHERVYVLEGGLGAWKAQGFKLEQGPPVLPAPARFKASVNAGLLVTRGDVLSNVDKQSFAMLDARPAERFHGHAPEPRPDMRAGHIPGSRNLPFTALLASPRGGALRPEGELEEIFSALNLSPDEKIAASCGSGITACTIALALFKARGQDCAIYDASWAEWGHAENGLPVEVSA